MADNTSSNIRNFHRHRRINLGTIVFGLVFVYIVCCVVLYFTRNRVSIYEVTTGSIAENDTFTGLALRSEQIFSADSSGYLTYVASEGERVGVQSKVYAVTTDGPLQKIVSETDTFTVSDDISQIITQLNGFRAGYDDSQFGDVYTFKSSLTASMLDTLADTSGSYEDVLGIRNAQAAGIVVYHTDGYEGVTYETFTPDMLNKNTYERTELAARETIQAGDSAYKLITSEEWEIIVRIDGTQRSKYEDDDYVEVRFLKDNNTAWAQISKFEIDDEWFCRLKFTNSMVRYATERYLEIDVSLDSTSGLKVPNSAIVEKQFYTVPVDYAVVNEDENKVGFYVRTTDKEGKTKDKYQEVTPYNMTDSLAYLDMSDFSEGTVLARDKGSSETYIVGTIDKLVGVYNVNKGYADFSLVTILCRNDDYSIVTPNESYGLTQYDHIVLDGSTVGDEDTIYQN